MLSQQLEECTGTWNKVRRSRFKWENIDGQRRQCHFMTVREIEKENGGRKGELSYLIADRSTGYVLEIPGCG